MLFGIEIWKGICYHENDKERTNSSWTPKELSEWLVSQGIDRRYGYRLTSSGELVVYSTEAAIVFYIFECFEAGDSLGEISTALADMEIVSSTGKAAWSRETISKSYQTRSMWEMLS